MGLKPQEELFCEIGISLGYLSKEQINKAIAQQEIDKTESEEKPIGSYFINEKILSKEKFGEIVSEVRHRQDLPPATKDENKNNLNISDLTLEEGESIEEKYCHVCDAYVPVKITKRKRDYVGCGCGCWGLIINLVLIAVTLGHWLTIWGMYAIGMLLFDHDPNDLVVCLKCNTTLKK